ncbi:SixA phosphatase family protein [Myroides odoratus]|uniref:SixA phosphatase family protein n=1 Tax=Myroides odoratus TaxID=256 RepID=UPI0039AFAC12
MKTLILIRHAKSCWETITEDKNRPISKTRGVQDALLVSQAIAPLLPDRFIVWTSTAKRAKQTATIFCQNLEINPAYVIEKEDIYTFDVKKLARSIKKCENMHKALIIFGHNDAITDFVNKFGMVSIDNVPTSGVVVMDFPQEDWKGIKNGTVISKVFPRDLK